MTRIESKKVVELTRINAKAKTQRFQALLYSLGGLAIEVVAIARYLRFDGTSYDSKMNATFDLMLFGILGLLLFAISATIYFRARRMMEKKGVV